MQKGSALVFAAVLASAGNATAAPVLPFCPDRGIRAVESPVQSDGAEFILVQARQRGGGGARRGAGGGAQRAAGGANRGGGFNSNNFQRDVANTGNRSANANRTVNATANRNVNVNGGGGCCYGNYNSGPSWGGVAAGVAAGAVVGAAVSSAANSPTYVAPPPTYPPGYVSPPPY
jgi:hypothetical protein